MTCTAATMREMHLILNLKRCLSVINSLWFLCEAPYPETSRSTARFHSYHKKKTIFQLFPIMLPVFFNSYYIYSTFLSQCLEKKA